MKVFIRTNEGVDPAPFLELIRHVYHAYPFVIKSKSEEYLAAIDPMDPAHRFGTLTHIEIFDSHRLRAHASIVVDERRSDVLFAGHLECTADDGASAMLFAAIEDVARQKGVRSIVGPVDRSLWRTFRTPTSGDGAPFFAEPYFPGHIGNAFLRHGYDIAQESETIQAVIPDLRLLPARKNGVHCVRVMPDEMTRIFPSLFRIISESFCDTRFFFPISFDEFCFSFAGRSDNAERAMLFAAKSEDEIVGFLLGYRSPEAEPPGVVAKTMAILPEFRRAGVGSALFQLFYTQALAEGFKNVYYSTMQKSNSDIRKLTGAGGSMSRCVRTYGLFEKTV